MVWKQRITDPENITIPRKKQQKVRKRKSSGRKTSAPVWREEARSPEQLKGVCVVRRSRVGLFFQPLSTQGGRRDVKHQICRLIEIKQQPWLSCNLPSFTLNSERPQNSRTPTPPHWEQAHGTPQGPTHLPGLNLCDSLPNGTENPGKQREKTSNKSDKVTSGASPFYRFYSEMWMNRGFHV